MVKKAALYTDQGPCRRDAEVAMDACQPALQRRPVVTKAIFALNRMPSIFTFVESIKP